MRADFAVKLRKGAPAVLDDLNMKCSYDQK